MRLKGRTRYSTARSTVCGGLLTNLQEEGKPLSSQVPLNDDALSLAPKMTTSTELLLYLIQTTDSKAFVRN